MLLAVQVQSVIDMVRQLIKAYAVREEPAPLCCAVAGGCVLGLVGCVCVCVYVVSLSQLLQLFSPCVLCVSSHIENEGKKRFSQDGHQSICRSPVALAPFSDVSNVQMWRSHIIQIVTFPCTQLCIGVLNCQSV